MENNKKFLVCIDPGHGPGTVNGSPDGTYKEREFAFDMGLRIKTLLEVAGVDVILTRTEDVKPSLTERARVSNNAGADLFVSLHSNAPGAAADPDGDGWSDPSGLLIYTSQAGEEAQRNKAARAILSKMEEAGVKLFGGGLAHKGWAVLTGTNAPAVLIEYGFHTNVGDVALLKDTVYRGELAKATAWGILAYLGVAEAEEDKVEGVDKLPVPNLDTTQPWYAKAQAWAKELGISDGTRPLELCTRAEVWQMLFNYDRASQEARRGE